MVYGYAMFAGVHGSINSPQVTMEADLSFNMC